MSLMNGKPIKCILSSNKEIVPNEDPIAKDSMRSLTTISYLKFVKENYFLNTAKERIKLKGEVTASQIISWHWCYCSGILGIWKNKLHISSTICLHRDHLLLCVLIDAHRPPSCCFQSIDRAVMRTKEHSSCFSRPRSLVPENSPIHI